MTSPSPFRARFYDPVLYFPLRKLRKGVVGMLSEYRHSKILDLCCGTGYQLKLLSRSGFTDLHCLDLSEPMLKVARRKGYPITVYNADAVNTGFEDGSFDVVILSFALHEKDTPTARAVLGEAERVLKNKGRLLVVDFFFDEDTKMHGRLGVRLVEGMAGGEHFKNFKNYMLTGGLWSLMKGMRFREVRQERSVAGGVAIVMFEKSANHPL